MEKTAGRAEIGRRVYRRSRGKRAELGEREKRRLIQLAACLALFLAVFFAKGADKLAGLRADLSSAISADMDFQAVFADLGWSIASGQPVGETLNDLWTDVFLPTEKAAPASWREGPLYQSSLETLSRRDAVPVMALMGLEPERGHADPMSSSGAPAEPEPEPEPAVVHVDYTGPTLPDNTTMDRYALNVGETVTPVMGVLSSDFGWREHPIDGGEKFHCGVDLAVDTGTTVKAFADGTVDYIGESDVYGKYLQIRHANGVTSFYAHCSKLCVQQGQTVAAGDKVAESGATGHVTGPHLHFELKINGVRLEPLYYIETRS